MPTTDKGFPYPENTGAVADGAGAIRALAEAVDLTMPFIAYGSVLFTGTDIPPNGAITFDATFPEGIFLGPPVCWAIKSGYVVGSTTMMADMVDEITADGCRVTIRNRGATDATFVNVPFTWFAMRA